MQFIDTKNREEIAVFIKDLKSKIEINDVKISDTKYPSLSLWFYYQEYLTSVLSLLFTFSSIEEKEHLFDVLKLDEFAIDAKDESQKTLENIDKYIRAVSTLIKI